MWAVGKGVVEMYVLRVGAEEGIAEKKVEAYYFRGLFVLSL